VLLSDVDIVTLQNPFQHLHRDVDVEVGAARLVR
jgi:hypothetical protein